jgi:glutaredoxin-like protein
MVNILNDQIIGEVQKVFEDLDEPVHVLFFGKKTECEYCDDTRQLAEEVTALSVKLELSVYDIDEDADIAAKYNVDKAPSLVIAAGNGNNLVDYGIRFAGIPSGHEFTSLIQDILLVSSRDSGLNEETRAFLKDLSEPIHMQVFVTSTCPHCPRAVILAHQMAMESAMVQAEMVEAMEFRDLADKYQIMGVPDTSINHGRARVVGAVPEVKLVEEIKSLLKSS